MKKLIVLAGGVGSRSGLDIPKQFYKVKGEMLINHLLKRIADDFEKIVVVLNRHDLSKDVFKAENIVFAEPGSERLFSIQNGLNELEIKNDDLVYIHDAARVMFSSEDVQAHVEAHSKSDAVISVGKSVDTMFVINEESKLIEKVYAKNVIVRGLTPQSYKGALLKEFSEYISKENKELDLTEIIKTKFMTVEQVNNLRKVTTAEDVKWIEGEL